MEETSLTTCKALEISLWDFKTLQSHILPEISNAAKLIDRQLPKTKWDITQELQLTAEDVSDVHETLDTR